MRLGGTPELFPLRMLTGADRLASSRTVRHLDSNLIERRIQELIFVAAEDVFSKGFFQVKFQEHVQKYFAHVLRELETAVAQLLTAYKMNALLEQLGSLPGKVEDSQPADAFKGNLLISKF